MAETQNSSKFFIQKSRKKGLFKGRCLMGISDATENVSLQDLLDFLAEKKIDPSKVELFANFMAKAK